MGLIDRVQKGLKVGLAAARGANEMDQIADRLDSMLQDGSLDQYFLDNEIAKATQKKTKSFLQIRRTSDNVLGLYSLLYKSVKAGELPPIGDPTRDIVLAEFWKKEPILAGAVYSMSAKMTALSWTVIGSKRPAKYYAELFSTASSMDGYDWGGVLVHYQYGKQKNRFQC